jgi:hypothetical protein
MTMRSLPTSVGRDLHHNTTRHGRQIELTKCERL